MRENEQSDESGTATLTVLQFPDPRLKQTSEPVAEIDDEIRALSERMLAVMYDEPGIGLDDPVPIHQQVTAGGHPPFQVSQRGRGRALRDVAVLVEA